MRLWTYQYNSSHQLPAGNLDDRSIQLQHQYPNTYEHRGYLFYIWKKDKKKIYREPSK